MGLYPRASRRSDFAPNDQFHTTSEVRTIKDYPNSEQKLTQDVQGNLHLWARTKNTHFLARKLFRAVLTNFKQDFTEVVGLIVLPSLTFPLAFFSRIIFFEISVLSTFKGCAVPRPKTEKMTKNYNFEIHARKKRQGDKLKQEGEQLTQHL